MSKIDLTLLKPAIESCIPLGRSGLLPALHAAQKIYRWLPQEAASEIAKALHVLLTEVYGSSNFIGAVMSLQEISVLNSRRKKRG